MNGYEKILSMMKKKGTEGGEKGVFLARVGKDFSVETGEMTLEKEDLLFAQPVLTGYSDAEGLTVAAITEGDAVLIKRLSEQKYAVICKVVEKE